MNETKKLHSMPSNILFFMKLLFSVSPLLVIGEFIWGILLIVPSRLVNVVGVKYIIDVVTEGERQERVFYAVGIIALTLILSKLFESCF